MDRVGNDTLYIIRAELVPSPRDGSLSRDWDNAPEVEIPYCSVQEYPAVTDEVDDRAREFASGWYWVAAPASMALVPEHFDRIRFEGAVYEMRGHPKPNRTLFGVIHHYSWVMQLRTETTGL